MSLSVLSNIVPFLMKIETKWQRTLNNKTRREKWYRETATSYGFVNCDPGIPGAYLSPSFFQGALFPG